VYSGPLKQARFRPPGPERTRVRQRESELAPQVGS